MKILVLPATPGSAAVAQSMTALSADGLVDSFYLVELGLGGNGQREHRISRVEDGEAESVPIENLGRRLDQDGVTQDQVRLIAAYPVLADEDFDERFAAVARDFLERMWQIVNSATSTGDIPLVLLPPSVRTRIPDGLMQAAATRSRVIVLPEELSTPDGVGTMAMAFEEAELKPEIVAAHGAHSLLNLLGLWRSMARSEVDGASCPIDTIPKGRQLTLVRSFSRIIDVGPIAASVASRALRVGDRWPNPEPQRCDEVGDDRIGDEIIDQVRRSYRVKHRNTVSLKKVEVIPIPELPELTKKEAISRVISLVKESVKEFPNRLKDAVDTAVADALYDASTAALGHPPNFRIRGQSAGSGKGKEQSKDRALLAVYEECRDVADNGAAVSEAWSDLLKSAMALVDVTDLPPGIESQSLVRGDDRRWVFTDPRRLTPDPVVLPTLPRGAVSARIGDPTSWPEPEPFTEPADPVAEASPSSPPQDSSETHDGASESTPEGNQPVSGITDPPAENSNVGGPGQRSTEVPAAVPFSAVAPPSTVDMESDAMADAEGDGTSSEAPQPAVSPDPQAEAPAEFKSEPAPASLQFDTAADAQAYESWYQTSSSSLFWLVAQGMQRDIEKARMAKERVDNVLVDPIDREEAEDTDRLTRALAFVDREQGRDPEAEDEEEESDEPRGLFKRFRRRRERKPFARPRRFIRTCVLLALLGGGAYAADTYLKGKAHENALIGIAVAAALVILGQLIGTRRDRALRRREKAEKGIEEPEEIAKLRELRKTVGTSMFAAAVVATALVFLLPGIGWVVAPLVILAALGGNAFALYKFMVWRRDEEHRLKVEEIERMNHLLQIAQTAAALERLERRYGELVDWTEIAAWLCHRPVWGAVNLDVDNQPTLSTEGLPVSLQVRAADADRQTEVLADALRSYVFRRRWMTNVFDSVSSAISKDLAERNPNAPKGEAEMEQFRATLFQPFADTGSIGHRSQLLRILQSGVFTSIGHTFEGDVLEFLSGREVKRVVRRTGLLESQLPAVQPVAPEVASSVANSVLKVRVGESVVAAAVLVAGDRAVTSQYALAGRSEVVVETRDGHRFNGVVARLSPVSDLALLQFETELEVDPVAISGGSEVGASAWSLMIPSEPNAEPRLRWGTVSAIGLTEDLRASLAGVPPFEVFGVRYSRPGVQPGAGVYDPDGRLLGVHTRVDGAEDLTAAFHRLAIPAEAVAAFIEGKEQQAGIVAQTFSEEKSESRASAAATEPLLFLREIIDVSGSPFFSSHWKQSRILGHSEWTAVQHAISVPSLATLDEAQALLLDSVAEGGLHLRHPLRLTSHRVEFSGEVPFDGLVYSGDGYEAHGVPSEDRPAPAVAEGDPPGDSGADY